jgi:hypothetical protein
MTDVTDPGGLDGSPGPGGTLLHHGRHLPTGIWYKSLRPATSDSLPTRGEIQARRDPLGRTPQCHPIRVDQGLHPHDALACERWVKTSARRKAAGAPFGAAKVRAIPSVLISENPCPKCFSLRPPRLCGCVWLRPQAAPGASHRTEVGLLEDTELCIPCPQGHTRGPGSRTAI